MALAQVLSGDLLGLRLSCVSEARGSVNASRPVGASLSAPRTRSSRLFGTAVRQSMRTSLGQPSRSKMLVVRASSADGNESPKTGYGLGGPGSFFGFGPRQEKEVGRLAMLGFAAALVMEVLTGKGVLGQLGLEPDVVRLPLLLGLVFLFVGGLLGGYVVVNNPPDISKAPPNAGAGLPRDPLKTFDPTTLDPLTTFTRGGVMTRPDGQKGRQPYVSDLKSLSDEE